jgi:phosphoglycolate phosphatase
MSVSGRRLLLWDVDHTLTVTAPHGSQCFAAALHRVAGVPLDRSIDFYGHTDRHNVTRALALHGITDPGTYLEPFFAALEAEFLAREHLLPLAGGPLPGVPEVLAALAGHPYITQTLVTGNIPAVARLKVAAFQLADYLDLSIGGYGSEHEARAPLVRLATERAAAKYGEPFDEVVVIGDTVRDVQAALANDAVAVGVATGTTSAADLSAAGAHAVLDSLADVDGALALLAG